jgi:hypothetical protein
MADDNPATSTATDDSPVFILVEVLRRSRLAGDRTSRGRVVVVVVGALNARYVSGRVVEQFDAGDRTSSKRDWDTRVSEEEGIALKGCPSSVFLLTVLGGKELYSADCLVVFGKERTKFVALLSWWK